MFADLIKVTDIILWPSCNPRLYYENNTLTIHQPEDHRVCTPTKTVCFYSEHTSIIKPRNRAVISLITTSKQAFDFKAKKTKKVARSLLIAFQLVTDNVVGRKLDSRYSHLVSLLSA